jgi:hypothetical protein
MVGQHDYHVAHHQVWEFKTLEEYIGEHPEMSMEECVETEMEAQRPPGSRFQVPGSRFQVPRFQVPGSKT